MKFCIVRPATQDKASSDVIIYHTCVPVLLDQKSSARKALDKAAPDLSQSFWTHIIIASLLG